MCQYKYYYSYVLKRKWAPTAAMILGRAFHSGQEYGVKQMIERSTPPADMVTEFAAAAYEHEITKEAQIEYNENDPNQGIVKDDLARMVGPVFEKKVSKLTPLSSEEFFDIDVAGIRVRGRLDIKDKEGDDGIAITELKTGARNPEALTAFDWQQSLYQLSQKVAEKPVRALRKIFTKRHMDIARNFSVTLYEKREDPASLQSDIVLGVGRVAESMKSASIHGYIKTPDLRTCLWCGFRKDCRPEIFGTEEGVASLVTKTEIFTSKPVKIKKEKV